MCGENTGKKWQSSENRFVSILNPHLSQIMLWTYAWLQNISTTVLKWWLKVWKILEMIERQLKFADFNFVCPLRNTNKPNFHHDEKTNMAHKTGRAKTFSRNFHWAFSYQKTRITCRWLNCKQQWSMTRVSGLSENISVFTPLPGLPL